MVLTSVVSWSGVYILLHVVFAVCDDLVVDECRAFHVMVKMVVGSKSRKYTPERDQQAVTRL